MKASPERRRGLSYLHGVLRAGARPLQYRGAVARLLGMRAGAWVVGSARYRGPGAFAYLPFSREPLAVRQHVPARTAGLRLEPAPAPAVNGSAVPAPKRRQAAPVHASTPVPSLASARVAASRPIAAALNVSDFAAPSTASELASRAPEAATAVQRSRSPGRALSVVVPEPSVADSATREGNTSAIADEVLAPPPRAAAQSFATQLGKLALALERHNFPRAEHEPVRPDRPPEANVASEPSAARPQLRADHAPRAQAEPVREIWIPAPLASASESVESRPTEPARSYPTAETNSSLSPVSTSLATPARPAAVPHTAVAPQQRPAAAQRETSPGKGMTVRKVAQRAATRPRTASPVVRAGFLERAHLGHVALRMLK